MPQSEAQKPDNESKSQRKKDMLALQKIGESLVKLTEEQLAIMNLPEDLFIAIKQMKSFTSNEAKRRQLQYIGKVMRQIDSESIKQVLKNIAFVHEKQTKQFHHIEEWRAMLLTEGDDAINSFLNNHPKANRQELRQLIRNALQDRKNNKNSGAEKALFKYVRSIIEDE